MPWPPERTGGTPSPQATAVAAALCASVPKASRLPPLETLGTAQALWAPRPSCGCWSLARGSCGVTPPHCRSQVIHSSSLGQRGSRQGPEPSGSLQEPAAAAPSPPQGKGLPSPTGNRLLPANLAVPQSWPRRPRELAGLGPLATRDSPGGGRYSQQLQPLSRAHLAQLGRPGPGACPAGTGKLVSATHFTWTGLEVWL